VEPAGYAGRGDEGHDCLIVAGPGCGVGLAKITVDVDIHFHFPVFGIPVHDTESKCRKKAPIRRDQGSVLIPAACYCPPVKSNPERSTRVTIGRRSNLLTPDGGK